MIPREQTIHVAADSDQNIALQLFLHATIWGPSNIIMFIYRAHNIIIKMLYALYSNDAKLSKNSTHEVVYYKSVFLFSNDYILTF